MKNENPLHTFESWTKERELQSLLESTDSLIEESSINESDTSFEGMSDDELEEACETECRAFLEDTAFFEDDDKLEEDRATKVAAGGAAAAAATLGSIGGISTYTTTAAGAAMMGGTAGTVTSFSLGTAIATSVAVLPVFLLAAGAGLLIYKVLKKKKELKKALQGEEPGTPKYDELKKRLKSLSIAELQEYTKIKEAKALAKGAKDGAKGEDNAPKDPQLKGAYEEGKKKGEEAKKEAIAIKKLPKEEQKEKIKEIQDKLAGAKAKQAKVKATAEKIKELKK